MNKKFAITSSVLLIIILSAAIFFMLGELVSKNTTDTSDQHSTQSASSHNHDQMEAEFFCHDNTMDCYPHNETITDQERQKIEESNKSNEQIPSEEFAQGVQISQAISDTLPIVAIHVSNHSRNLWDEKTQDYFESYIALTTVLTNHKIPYIILDSNEIISGALMQEDSIKYPIVFSLNNKFVSEQEIKKISEYVSNGGTLYFNHNSFTQKNDNQYRNKGCFLLDVPYTCRYDSETKETYYDQTNSLLYTNLAEKNKQHQIINHVPNQETAWKMSKYQTSRYDVFAVNAPQNDTYITARRKDKNAPLLVISQIDNGSVIYDAQMNSFWGRYEGEPAVYNVITAINAIKWSFEKSNTPFIFIKPWGEDQAAFTLRFDVETDRDDFFKLFPQFVDIVDQNKVPAVFYILVDQMRKGPAAPGVLHFKVNDPEVAQLVVDAHNRTNIMVASHSTWHRGPDFDGNEGFDNIEYSLDILEQVLGERPDDWVAPAFGANLDFSLQKLNALGIKTTGDQRIGYLPFFAPSPRKEKEFYDILQIPTNDYYHPRIYQGRALGTVMEHHNKQSVKDGIAFYYNQGALINIYAHLFEDNLDKLRTLIQESKKYDDIWFTTPDELYDYWKQRVNVNFKSIIVNKDKKEIVLTNTNSRTQTVWLKVILPQDAQMDKISVRNQELDYSQNANEIEFPVRLSSNRDTKIEIFFKQ